MLKIALLAIVDARRRSTRRSCCCSTASGSSSRSCVVVAALVNWIYFSRKRIAPKYLTPGIVLLVFFQIFTLVYTAYIGFTNYGTGHNGTQEQAVASLMRSALERVPDSPTYGVTVVERFGELGPARHRPDRRQTSRSARTISRSSRSPTRRSRTARPSPSTAGPPSPSPGDRAQRRDRGRSRSPYSDDPNDGAIRTPDGQNGYLYVSTLAYDAAAGTMTDTTTGVVYTDIGTGAFTSPDGEELLPGWQIVVGFDNFVRALTDTSIRGPLIAVTHLDVRLRVRLGRHDVRARAPARDRLQQPSGCGSATATGSC